MKIFKMITLVVMSAIIFASCSSMPKLYDEEIRDVVKFNIASFDWMIDMASDPEDAMVIALIGEEFFTEILDIPQQMWLKEADAKYKDILFSLSKDHEYSEFYEDILNNYNNLSISLSEYKEIESTKDYEAWSFKEMITGIEFIFEYTTADDEDNWSCEATGDSIERYF